MGRLFINYRWVGLVGLVGGCGPVAAPGSEGATMSMTTGSVSPTTSAAGDTIGMASETGAAAGTTLVVESTTPTFDGSGETDAGSNFLMGGPDFETGMDCDKFAQDCPAGEKCMPYASDGGSSWNDDKCVPVMEDPAQVGESCFVVGNGVSGVDNCDLGLMCWDTDAENQGTCVAICKGSPDMTYCEQPKFLCAVTAEAAIAICLPGCEPLEQDCQRGDVCIGDPYLPGFLCVLDASLDEGQTHDPCMYGNACDPGLLCVDPASAVECDQAADGCCEPFCEFGAMNTCPGAEQVCLQYLVNGMAVPGYEYVGICSVPM